ncbi:MAG: CPBP family intramembrane metalloprotease [bacterium]|nr:CPBP family intramembrane metalloprotease [bacterium]
MSVRGRIWVIYVKELVDILRDRRTLVAMVVVPVLLYPLLMLGSVQAISLQEGSLRQDTVIIATPDAGQRAFLERLIGEYNVAAEASQDAATNGTGDVPALQLLHVRVLDASRDFGDPRELKDLVRARAVHLGVRIRGHERFHPLRGHLHFDIECDSEEARSGAAVKHLEEVIAWAAKKLKANRLGELGISPELLEPISISRVDLPTAGSVLSQILPLILVLMTITGAIYPAIDLTAGERERGTLETLMVCPVPVIQLVVGKFLVITTIAILGAVLNLASISATVYFGGFQAVLAGSEDATFPFAVFPVILAALIPFAVFFSAVMIAVCSYAHTFKEAQNYITPIILAALVPGGIAALPASKLAGPMLVMPVANMVLLTKELLLGASEGQIIGGNVTWTSLVWVLTSTVLYAAAAVAVAAKIFGTESVIFADTGSIRSAFARRLFRPTRFPSVSMVALVTALLFPAWFYLQSSLSTAAAGDFVRVLRSTAVWLPILFVAAPLAVLCYWKVAVADTWRLHGCGVRFFAAAVLIGAGAWVLLHELFVLQSHLIPVGEQLYQAESEFVAALGTLAPWVALMMIAVIPGIGEELFFRGFLMSGLIGTGRKWTAIFVSACVFGVFHFTILKLANTVLLGVVLGYVCWQARSIWPALIAHVLHNGFAVLRAQIPALSQRLGQDPEHPLAHLPAEVLVGGVLLTVLGIAACRTAQPRGDVG